MRFGRHVPTIGHGINFLVAGAWLITSLASAQAPINAPSTRQLDRGRLNHQLLAYPLLSKPGRLTTLPLGQAEIRGLAIEARRQPGPVVLSVHMFEANTRPESMVLRPRSETI